MEYGGTFEYTKTLEETVFDMPSQHKTVFIDKYIGKPTSISIHMPSFPPGRQNFTASYAVRPYPSLLQETNSGERTPPTCS
uniref:Uncharacterized protein n=1 Tax=Setaria digitata TaxID=48799 RepID=A0A915PDK3_9BILA